MTVELRITTNQVWRQWIQSYPSFIVSFNYNKIRIDAYQTKLSFYNLTRKFRGSQTEKYADFLLSDWEFVDINFFPKFKTQQNLIHSGTHYYFRFVVPWKIDFSFPNGIIRFLQIFQSFTSNES